MQRAVYISTVPLRHEDGVTLYSGGWVGASCHFNIAVVPHGWSTCLRQHILHSLQLVGLMPAAFQWVWLSHGQTGCRSSATL